MDDHQSKKSATPSDVWQSLHSALNTKVPHNVEVKLKKRLEGFREDLQVHPYITRGRAHELSLWRKAKVYLQQRIRPVLIATSGIAVVVLMFLFLPGQSPPSWADVIKQLGHSHFVTASVYMRIYPFHKPEMVEYWRGQGNKLRILSNHLVTFASKEEVRTFNLATRKEDRRDNITKFILNLYDYEESNTPGADYAKALYLDLYEGKASESTYLVNASPEISDNLLVYDLKHKKSGLFLRVWVLRTSMLPVRLHYWNDYGARTDVLFSYSKEQPEGFFDADYFSEKIKNSLNSSASLMYLGLEDPGGRAIPSPGI